MKRLLYVLTLALPLCALAAEETSYYNPGLSIGVAGTARTFDLNHARTGVGLEANLWFANNLGLGVEGLTENTAGRFVDTAQGNLLWRITSGRAALNLSAGAGWDFERNEIYASAGGGPEYAISRAFHLFADARAVKPIEGGNINALFRAGLRLQF